MTSELASRYESWKVQCDVEKSILIGDSFYSRFSFDDSILFFNNTIIHTIVACLLLLLHGLSILIICSYSFIQPAYSKYKCIIRLLRSFQRWWLRQNRVNLDRIIKLFNSYLCIKLSNANIE